MTEKSFGTMSIKKLFPKLVIPSIISMLFASLNMLVDGAIAGKVLGTDALVAINLVMPFVLTIFALIDILVVGGSIKISILLGKQDEKNASRIFSSIIFINFIVSLVISIVGILFSKDVINFFIEEKLLATNIYEYLKVFLILLPVTIIAQELNFYARVAGHPKISMDSNIMVTIINVILNLMLVVYFKLGISYIAFATNISIIIANLIIIYPFITKQYVLKFTKPKIKLKEYLAIMYNGSSDFVANISVSFMAMITNYYLLKLGGPNAVAALSIAMYIDMLFMSVIFGTIDAITPAIAYNYGKKKKKRILALWKLTSKVMIIFSLATIVLIILFPDKLVSLFSTEKDPKIIELAITALMIFAPTYFFAWFNSLVGSFLTAFEKPGPSLLLMILESIIIPLILYPILAKLLGLNGIFFALTLAAGLTAIASMYIWHKYKKPIFGKLIDEDKII